MSVSEKKISETRVPQLIITLSPQGMPVIELPGINGSRRKIPLEINSSYSSPIENAIELIKAFQNLEELRSIFSETSKKSRDNPDDPKIIKLNRIAEANLASAEIKIENSNSIIAALNTILSSNETILGILSNILEAQNNSHYEIATDGNPTERQVIHWQKHCTYNPTTKKMEPNLFGDPTCAFCRAEGRFEPGKNRENNKSIRGISLFECYRLGLISRGFKQTKNPNIFTKGTLSACIYGEKIFDKKRVFWSKVQLENLISDGKAYAKKFGFQPTEAKPRKVSGGVTVKKLVKMPPKPTSKASKAFKNIRL